MMRWFGVAPIPTWEDLIRPDRRMALEIASQCELIDRPDIASDWSALASDLRSTPRGLRRDTSCDDLELGGEA